MSWKRVLPKASRRTSKILWSTGKSVFCVRKKNSERQLRYCSFLGRKVKNQTSKISFWFVSIQYIFPPCLGHCLSLRINKEFGGLMEDVHYFRYFSFTQVCHVVVLCDPPTIRLDHSKNIPAGSPESRFALANWSHIAAPSWNNAVNQQGNEWRENLHITQSLCSMTQSISHL